MKIRPYIKGDETQIVWLINNTWRVAYKNIFPSDIFDERDKTIDERIKRFAENQENGNICFVAEEDLKIVGVLVGGLKSNIEEFDKNNYARINILYIDKEFQRFGLGKKLVDEFVEILKQNNIDKYIIGVLKDNNQGRSAYEKWGGVLTDYTEDFIVSNVSREEIFYKYDVRNTNS